MRNILLPLLFFLFISIVNCDLDRSGARLFIRVERLNELLKKSPALPIIAFNGAFPKGLSLPKLNITGDNGRNATIEMKLTTPTGPLRFYVEPNNVLRIQILPFGIRAMKGMNITTSNGTIMTDSTTAMSNITVGMSIRVGYNASAQKPTIQLYDVLFDSSYANTDLPQELQWVSRGLLREFTTLLSSSVESFGKYLSGALEREEMIVKLIGSNDSFLYLDLHTPSAPMMRVDNQTINMEFPARTFVRHSNGSKISTCSSFPPLRTLSDQHVQLDINEGLVECLLESLVEFAKVEAKFVNLNFELFKNDFGFRLGNDSVSLNTNVSPRFTFNPRSDITSMELDAQLSAKAAVTFPSIKLDSIHILVDLKSNSLVLNTTNYVGNPKFDPRVQMSPQQYGNDIWKLVRKYIPIPQVGNSQEYSIPLAPPEAAGASSFLHLNGQVIERGVFFSVMFNNVS
eukprot:TRINITY_DN5104_c0_g1_i1.p1 TRINITY_DN5104_c0_g1~~TRINITY_DN5104_c0_g1_i1.p1  ORF type:complete len:468 (-),score=129.26 TRINITY_DN5104_c0_g1_i1:11-1381(-)